MNVKDKSYSTLWMDNGKIKIINQTKLPFKFEVKELNSLSDFCYAIKKMEVRGAPLIGVTAAFAFALSINKNPYITNIQKSYKALLETRPTAINLKWALNFIESRIKKVPKKKRGQIALQLATRIREEDIVNNMKIALNGFKIIKNFYEKRKRRINILTHCNAGWLATIDWGTALAPIFMANRNGIPVHIWVDETRPRNQGALLTAWELENEKVPYTVIVDNAGGHLMQKKMIDLCMVGSDRTTLKGDVCNKIGTYLKALSAFHNKVPFYVALPFSTIDFNTKNYKTIPIEEREGEELSDLIFEKNGKTTVGKIYLKDSKTYNPAFDVTPSKYVTRLITENGVIKPTEKDIDKKRLNEKN